jgi:hypothetical protein
MLIRSSHNPLEPSIYEEVPVAEIVLSVGAQVIEEIHTAFLEAGADILETNTFNGTTISQGDYELDIEEEVPKPLTASHFLPLPFSQHCIHDQLKTMTKYYSTFLAPPLLNKLITSRYMWFFFHALSLLHRLIHRWNMWFCRKGVAQRGMCDR